MSTHVCVIVRTYVHLVSHHRSNICLSSVFDLICVFLLSKRRTRSCELEAFFFEAKERFSRQDKWARVFERGSVSPSLVCMFVSFV